MNETDSLHIHLRLPAQESTSPKTITLNLQQAQFLHGPSGCGKSRLVDMIQEYCAAVERDLDLLSQHQLHPPTHRPTTLELSSIPDVHLINPEILFSLPETLAELWNVAQWITTAPATQHVRCTHCGGNIKQTPASDWESILLDTFQGSLVTLSIPRDYDADNPLPLNGRVLIHDMLYSLDDDDERCSAQQQQSRYILHVYDRLRIDADKQLRIRNAIQEAMQSPFGSLCVSLHTSPALTTTWLNSSARCSSCGTPAAIPVGSETVSGGCLGSLKQDEAFQLPLNTLKEKLSVHHDFQPLLNRICAMGLGYRTLATSCSDCSLAEQLLAYCAQRHERLLFVDEIASILTRQDWQLLLQSLKKLESMGSCVVMIDNRVPNECTLPLISYPVEANTAVRPGISQGLYARSRKQPPPLVRPESASCTLATGTLYTIAAEQGNNTMFDELVQSLKRTKITHGLSVVVHEARSRTSKSRHTIASYLGIDRELRQHFSETIEAKAAGFTAADFGNTKAATESIKFLGYRYHDYDQFNLAEASSILKHLPIAGNRLHLAQSLGLNSLILSQKIQDISSGERQRVSLLAESVSRKLPYIWILDHPAWCLDTDALECVANIFEVLCNAGALIIVYDNYPWKGTALQI